MPARGLDHVNIVTADMAGTVRFYVDLLGLEPRPGASSRPSSEVQWLYDPSGRAVVHVNAAGAFTPLGRTPGIGADTNALHHVAFDCTDYEGMRARIDAMELQSEARDIPAFDLRQIFVVDPNGVLLELNFRG